MWWIIAIVAVLAAWWLLPRLVGLLTPATVSGRLYLRAQLKAAGALSIIPDECVRELAADAFGFAKVYRRVTHEGMKTEMMNRLDRVVYLTAAWVYGEPIEGKDAIFSTLAKYGVPRGEPVSR